MEVTSDSGVHNRSHSLSRPSSPAKPSSLSGSSSLAHTYSRQSRPVRSSHKARRVVQTVFLLALILFLVLTSLLTYAHFSHNGSLNTGTTTTGTVATTSPQATTSISPTGSALQSSWQILPSLPLPEADNTAIYVSLQGQSYIYVSAGYLGRTHIPHYDRGLYRYDSTTAHWDKVVDATFPLW